MTHHVPTKPTTQDVILIAIKQRLTEGLPSVFNADNVRLTLDPDPPSTSKSPPVVGTITPLNGTFPDEFGGEGGDEVLIEQSGVLIAIWSRQNTDQTGKADEILLGLGSDKTRSMLRLKREMLRLFAGHMLKDPSDGQPILTAHMQPTYANTPRFDNDDRVGRYADVAVGFTTEFLWNLETQP